MMANQCLMAPCTTSPAPPSAPQPSSRPMPRHQSHWCTPTKETDRMVVDYDERTGKKMINQYLLLRTLGQGCHGRVKLAVDVTTGQRYAIKIIDKWQSDRRLSLRVYNSGGNDGNEKFRARTPDSFQPSSLAKRRSYRVSPGQLEKIRKEIAILKKCRHPNIVHLYEVIDDPAAKKIYLVLGYMEGGELRWRDGDDRPVLNLDQIRTIFRDLVLGIEYLHYQGVIHRDIKPANLLLDADGAIKISDFGVSHFNQHAMHRQSLTHRPSLTSSDSAKQQSPLRSMTLPASKRKGAALEPSHACEPSPADRTTLEHSTPVSSPAMQPPEDHMHLAPSASPFGSMLGSARGLNSAADTINQFQPPLPAASPQRPLFTHSFIPSLPNGLAPNTAKVPPPNEAGAASAGPALTNRPTPCSPASPHMTDSMTSGVSAVSPARRTPVLFFGSSDDESDAEHSLSSATSPKPALQPPFTTTLGHTADTPPPSTALGVYDCDVDYDNIDDSDSDDFWSDFDFDEAEAVVEDYDFSVPNSPLPSNLPGAPSLSMAEQLGAPHLTTSEYSSEPSPSFPPHSPMSPTGADFSTRSRRGSTVQWATTKAPGPTTKAGEGVRSSSGSTQPVLLGSTPSVAPISRPMSRYSLTDAGLPLPDNSLLDSDKELAKTAGSPAFFAPELCCTTAELNHLLAKWRRARGVSPQPRRQLSAPSVNKSECKPARLRSRSLNPISSLVPKSPTTLPNPLSDSQGPLGRSQSSNWLTARVRRPSLSTLVRTATMRRSQSQQPTPSSQLATGSDTLAIQLNASVSAADPVTPGSPGGVRLFSPLAPRRTISLLQPSPVVANPAAAAAHRQSSRSNSRPSLGLISAEPSYGAPSQSNVQGMAGKSATLGSAHPSPVRPASAVILDHATPWRPQPLGRSATSQGRLFTRSNDVCSHDAGGSNRSTAPWNLSSTAPQQRRASLQVTSLLPPAPGAIASPVLAQPTAVQLDHPASPTPSYHGITKAIDVWAMGVTLYCLVYGRCPFIADTEYELFQIIPHQALEFPDEVRGAGSLVPDGLKDLLRGLMDKDYTHRLTIDQVKRHPWVVEGLEDGHRWAESTDPHGQYPEVEVSPHDISNALVPLYQWPKRLGQGIRRMSLSVVNSLKGWRGKKKSSPG